MTTRAWVEKHIAFALKADNLKELEERLRAIMTRLELSPLAAQEGLEGRKSK